MPCLSWKRVDNSDKYPGPVAATKTEPTFQRGRHLAMAIVGLVHAPLTRVTGPFVLSMMGTWGAVASTINRLIHLCFAALVAWLAIAVLRTEPGVCVGPRRWRSLGGIFALWYVGLELYVLFAVWRWPVESLAVAREASAFIELGELRFGWLVLAVLVAAAAEEIVYRVLLLRALEGYMSSSWALVIQAALFELVHAYVYDYGSITGQRFMIAYMLGYAFARTRSLGVPTLLHAAHNMLLYVAVWYFNQ
jgi:membrane protease YdiL (CAAX protease family)